MGGDEHVPDTAARLAIDEHVLHARMHELQPHVHREAHRDQADDRGRHEIEDPDVLVVRRHEPAGEEARLRMIVVGEAGGISHMCLLAALLVRPSPPREAGLS